MDEKKFRGEEEHKITQEEIDAWHRGRDDANRNARMSALAQTVSETKAIAVIKQYALTGDVYTTAMKFDLYVNTVRSILEQFGIQSTADARRELESGKIGEKLAADCEAAVQAELDRQSETLEAAKRLQAIEDAQASNEEEKPETDIIDRQDEAQQKNKRDRLRQILQEGVDDSMRSSTFRIPEDREAEFINGLHGGLQSLKRRFGGSTNETLREIKRLQPRFDISLLRP